MDESDQVTPKSNKKKIFLGLVSPVEKVRAILKEVAVSPLVVLSINSNLQKGRSLAGNFTRNTTANPNPYSGASKYHRNLPRIFTDYFSA
jgi:hypothetical protein